MGGNPSNWGDDFEMGKLIPLYGIGVIYFCEKASLRISGIILFECKVPWMLKTGGVIFQRNIKYFTANFVVLCGENMVSKNWKIAQQKYLDWTLFLYP